MKPSSHLTKTLKQHNNQLASNTPAVWGRKYQKILEQLIIGRITNTPILAYQDFNLTFPLHASGSGLGQYPTCDRI